MPALVMTSGLRLVVLLIIVTSAWLGSSRPLHGVDPDRFPLVVPVWIWPGAPPADYGDEP